MKIIIDNGGDWGVAQLPDIEALLYNTATHLNKTQKNRFNGTIFVTKSSSGEEYPEVLSRTSSSDPFIVKLSVKDRYWAQYAYQFSHEFCHILSRFESQFKNPNNWFHESICELASVFTLREMGKDWPKNPPYPHWASFAPSLTGYAEERISREKVKLGEGTSITEWLLSQEDCLRKDPYQRKSNAIIAYELLPIFESDLNKWNTIAALPTSTDSLHEYLKDWQKAVEPDEVDFIEVVAATIGCPINE